MHFIEHERDEALRLRLITEEAFTLAEITGLVARVTKESGDLFEDVILPFAEDVDERAWVYWLVSRYQLFRTGRVVVEPEFIEGERFSREDCQKYRNANVYPVDRTADRKRFVVAVGRPDTVNSVRASLGEEPVMLAATPLEIRAISKVFKTFA